MTPPARRMPSVGARGGLRPLCHQPAPTQEVATLLARAGRCFSSGSGTGGGGGGGSSSGAGVSGGGPERAAGAASSLTSRVRASLPASSPRAELGVEAASGPNPGSWRLSPGGEGPGVAAVSQRPSPAPGPS